jgi:hypothetical protein
MLLLIFSAIVTGGNHRMSLNGKYSWSIKENERKFNNGWKK